MLKMWGKIIKEDKTVKHATIKVDEYELSFFQMVKKMCEKLAISTPVVISNHVLDFKRFNICVFKPDDFVEKIDFDKLTLHNISGE